ncbi:hypothetical protein C8R43DRAFT_873922 [Mycena crocata]|nr:hypothetical protein C8R43DRAFT_873922 [Mycena crocata]
MPKIYADFAAKMDRLFSRTGLAPAFQHSVFTTSEISFGDAPSVSRKNLDAVFYGFEALTVFGEYDWEVRGHIIFWDDEGAIPLRPGSTVLFPAGTKRYSFLAVASNETRFVFRQFCHSGIIRWLERGCMSDLEFEENASVEEMAMWNAKRNARGRTSAKLYGKLKDVYVV